MQTAAGSHQPRSRQSVIKGSAPTTEKRHKSALTCSSDLRDLSMLINTRRSRRLMTHRGDMERGRKMERNVAELLSSCLID